VSDWAPKGLCK